jgi:hypothetical protein
MTDSYSTLRISILLFITIVLFTCPSNAQTRKGEFINASIGLGLSSPDDESDVFGNGFYAQGEYVLNLNTWFGLRPYAGFILTSSEQTDDPQNQSAYEVTSNAFLLGGKVRVTAPFPWVAPYFEIGIGASMGSFKTFTPFTNLEENGILFHVPFSVGLALGRKNNFEIEYTYYFHPAVEQACGAVAIGYTFPLK